MTIETTAWFDKQIKRLAKKYASIPADYRSFLESLDNEPTQGTPILPRKCSIGSDAII